MFVVNNLRNFSKNNKSQVYKSGHILPVLTAEELLNAGRHQALIEQIKDFSQLPNEHFDTLYKIAIKNFAEFVQVIPNQVNAALNGLLNQGIARAVLTLQTFLANQGKALDPLSNYATFTAALFLDVSKVVINQKIVIVDEEGNYINDWRPFEGSMIGCGQFYKMYPIAQAYLRLQDAITPLLARQLLPKQGFLWIASDPRIFANWLDILRGDDSQGGRMGRALSYVKREDIINLEDALPQSAVSMLESEVTKHGEAFYSWLKNSLENDQIKVNTTDAGVHVVKEGVFIERKLFKQFADVYNVPVNMNVVFSQFGNLMGIIKKGGTDYTFDQFFSQFPEAKEGGGVTFTGALGQRPAGLREGMLLSDPNIIFVNVQIPATTSLLKAVQTASTERRHHLPTIQDKSGPEAQHSAK